MEYSSHSSTRAARWNQSARSMEATIVEVV
jgi:hypothetical protein